MPRSIGRAPAKRPRLGTILDVVQNDFEVDVERVMADSAYTTGENLTAAEAKNVELIGPLAETKCEDNPAEREEPTQPVAGEKLTVANQPSNETVRQIGVRV